MTTTEFLTLLLLSEKNSSGQKSNSSDGSGMEKVGLGQVRVYPNFGKSASGISGIIGKVGFGRLRKSDFGYWLFYFLQK